MQTVCFIEREKYMDGGNRSILKNWKNAVDTEITNQNQTVKRRLSFYYPVVDNL